MLGELVSRQGQNVEYRKATANGRFSIAEKIVGHSQSRIQVLPIHHVLLCPINLGGKAKLRLRRYGLVRVGRLKPIETQADINGQPLESPLVLPEDGVILFAIDIEVRGQVLGYLNWQKRPSGWGALWLVTFAIAAVVSTPLNFLISNGNSGVGLGDSIYTGLYGAHVPRILASLIGEASVDLPDKLITVVVALLIAQGLPRSRAAPASVDLNLGEAATFVVRSDRWVRRLLAAAVCLLFFWLIVPLLLLIGYVVEISRRVRAGDRQLPAWTHRWRKISDGFKLLAVILIWLIPSVLLSIPAAIVSTPPPQTPPAVDTTASDLAGIVAAVGSVWSLVVVLLLLLHFDFSPLTCLLPLHQSHRHGRRRAL